MGQFILGIALGFAVAFFVIKKQINKDGAGQMRVCQNCPYFKAPIPSDEDFGG